MMPVTIDTTGPGNADIGALELDRARRQRHLSARQPERAGQTRGEGDVAVEVVSVPADLHDDLAPARAT